MTIMNSTFSSDSHPTQSHPASDVYDPDDVMGSTSPKMEVMQLKLTKIPSPEPLALGPKYKFKKGQRKDGMHTNIGEDVLLRQMSDGRYERHTIASPITEDQPVEGESDTTSSDEEDAKSVVSETEFTGKLENGQYVQVKDEVEEKPELAAQCANETDLLAMAAQAFDSISREPNLEKIERLEVFYKDESTKHVTDVEMEDVKPSLCSTMVDTASAQPILTVNTYDAPIKSPDFLPPIQSSPVSSNGHSITLPSLSAQLGDIDIKQPPDTPRDSAYPQSPPPPPLFNQTSPTSVTSPRDPRALPSPAGQRFMHEQQMRRHSHADQHTYMGNSEYSSSSNAETPSDMSTPGSASFGLHRMSIDVMDNPQIGGYVCNFTGCSAAPFQTQYLLNSHANVHSSSRPHYCPVKGCTRAEGGKGFKRKNEMIRHGLVHDSPGYVCPFCPEREHKYPRPDNLQRHVKVHHLDKDKDDPALRDVLAQRPEGPSRGRRRRGTTGAV